MVKAYLTTNACRASCDCRAELDIHRDSNPKNKYVNCRRTVKVNGARYLGIRLEIRHLIWIDVAYFMSDFHGFVRTNYFITLSVGSLGVEC